MTIFKEGDLVRFWTREECNAYNRTTRYGEGESNWGEIGEVARTDSGLARVEFRNPLDNRTIGDGALTLVKTYEDRIREVLGEDYA